MKYGFDMDTSAYSNKSHKRLGPLNYWSRKIVHKTRGFNETQDKQPHSTERF